MCSSIATVLSSPFFELLGLLTIDYNSPFQVLITEAEADKKIDESGKAVDRKAHGSKKDSEVKSSSETHVELDSRLLSALLTVSTKVHYI